MQAEWGNQAFPFGKFQDLTYLYAPCNQVNETKDSPDIPF